ncbi:MAG: HAMP domain-containing protein [Deltaproteobacteria bacterium]|nr:HAMP domain-containing protein [Deltaproteobacteria bacterium]
MSHSNTPSSTANQPAMPDMPQGQNETQGVEHKRRQREFFIIAAILPVIILLTYIESHISIISGDLPVATNIFVLGLININIILLVLLIFLVFRNAVKIFLESRRRLLGSRLRTKIISAFVALTIIPTFLLFFIVIGLVNKSIDSWFNIKIEDSLKGSLELAQNYYRDTSNKILNGAWRISREIAGDMPVAAAGGLRKLVEARVQENDFSTIEVYSTGGRRLAYAISSDVTQSMVPDVAGTDLERVFREGAASFVQTLAVGDVVRGMAPVFSSPGGGDVVGAVVVSYYVPKSLVTKMNEISAAFEGYRQLKILKNPVKASYFIILLTITLLIVFLSIWIGQYMARAITVPIFELAEGTHAVASGNLDYRINARSDDEIGLLVKSFNRMTEDLKVGKTMLEEANRTLRGTNAELETRRRYIEIVLSNIPAGVISIDRAGRITALNRVGAEILSIEESNAVGRSYKEVLRPEDMELFRDMIKEMNEHESEYIERQAKVRLRDRVITVLVNLNALKDFNGEYIGMVAVLDDLTHLLKTQRMLAWKEVAKRIAHEIKNPLTPIQLSAQRLRKKYLDRFEGDGAVFDECTRTIVREVDELKTLVNEFSSFARMPAANPSPNDLNLIVEETMALYKTGQRAIVFHVETDPGLPTIEIDRDQIKRALINLIDNSIAAIEGPGEIKVETRYDHEMKLVRLEVADTGRGIPPEDKSRLFEPYFSTKKSGTGLGLAIVNNIISDHNGYIRVKDNYPGGTRFVIELPVKAGMA